MCDSRVILLGETTCLSLLGVKGWKTSASRKTFHPCAPLLFWVPLFNARCVGVYSLNLGMKNNNKYLLLIILCRLEERWFQVHCLILVFTCSTTANLWWKTGTVLSFTYQRWSAVSLWLRTHSVMNTFPCNTWWACVPIHLISTSLCNPPPPPSRCFH